MITIEKFKELKTFKEFLEAGEPLNINSIIPTEYYKSVLYFFEEPTFTCIETKTKLMNIIFEDGDIITYIVKYNQIGNNKVYKLSNMPFSKYYNLYHVIEVITIIFDKIPSAMILMHEKEIKDTPLYNKNNILKGYENYYYSYDGLLQKINTHKTTRRWARKYEQSILSYYNTVTNEAKERILSVYSEWFNTHPNPRTSSKRELDALLKQNNISIFILKYKDKDIGFTVGTIHNNKYFCSHNGYDLSRIPEYYNASLFMELNLCKYLKEKLHIHYDYVYGYSNENITLRNYKETWSDGKIVTYKIDNNNLDDYLMILDSM